MLRYGTIWNNIIFEMTLQWIHNVCTCAITIAYLLSSSPMHIFEWSIDISDRHWKWEREYLLASFISQRPETKWNQLL